MQTKSNGVETQIRKKNRQPRKISQKQTEREFWQTPVADLVKYSKRNQNKEKRNMKRKSNSVYAPFVST
jgi:hypothetical protein